MRQECFQHSLWLNVGSSISMLFVGKCHAKNTPLGFSGTAVVTVGSCLQGGVLPLLWYVSCPVNMKATWEQYVESTPPPRLVYLCCSGPGSASFIVQTSGNRWKETQIIKAFASSQSCGTCRTLSSPLIRDHGDRTPLCWIKTTMLVSSPWGGAFSPTW